MATNALPHAVACDIVDMLISRACADEPFVVYTVTRACRAVLCELRAVSRAWRGAVDAVWAQHAALYADGCLALLWNPIVRVDVAICSDPVAVEGLNDVPKGLEPRAALLGALRGASRNVLARTHVAARLVWPTMSLYRDIYGATRSWRAFFDDARSRGPTKTEVETAVDAEIDELFGLLSGLCLFSPIDRMICAVTHHEPLAHEISVIGAIVDRLAERGVRVSLAVRLSQYQGAIVSLAPLANVCDLRLDGCEYVTDVAPLARVSSLHLEDCKLLVDVTPLANVRRLYIGRARALVDLAPLSMVPTLSVTHATGVTSVEPLRGATRVLLQKMHGVTDFSPLADVSELEVISCDLAHDGVMELGTVRTLSLFCCDNVGSVAPLRACRALRIVGPPYAAPVDVARLGDADTRLDTLFCMDINDATRDAIARRVRRVHNADTQ